MSIIILPFFLSFLFTSHYLNRRDFCYRVSELSSVNRNTLQNGIQVYADCTHKLLVVGVSEGVIRRVNDVCG